MGLDKFFMRSPDIAMRKYLVRSFFFFLLTCVGADSACVFFVNWKHLSDVYFYPPVYQYFSPFFSSCLI